MSTNFYLCAASGCNRKYKTDAKWTKHMFRDHGVNNPTLPDPVAVSQKAFSSDVRSNKVLRAAHDNSVEREREKLRAEVLAAVEEEKARYREQQDRASSACCICEDRKACVVAVPCGHASFCDVCLYAVPGGKCPVCRTKMEQIVRIYT